MSILFVSASWPSPLATFRHGTAQRMRLLLRALSQLGQPLDALFFHHPESRPNEADITQLRADMSALWGVELRHIAVECQAPEPRLNLGLWRSYLRPALRAEFQPQFAALAEARHAAAVAQAVQRTKPSLLIAHRLRTMVPIEAGAPSSVPRVLDLDDIEHKAFRRALALPPHWRAKRLMRAWVPAISALERRSMAQASATLVCSEADAIELQGLYGRGRAVAIPNALPAPPAMTPIPRTPTVMFIGIYSYPPNLHAARWLVEEVWPLVLAQRPEARLLLAGKDSHLLPWQADKQPRGIELRGFVEDLEALYAETRVVACPVQSGGGTRIKIIEAALRCRPVVSTTVGCEGLGLRADRGQIAIADDAGAFAACLLHLLASDATAQAQAERGLEAAQTAFGESAAIQLLCAEFGRVMALG